MRFVSQFASLCPQDCPLEKLWGLAHFDTLSFYSIFAQKSRAICHHFSSKWPYFPLDFWEIPLTLCLACSPRTRYRVSPPKKFSFAAESSFVRTFLIKPYFAKLSFFCTGRRDVGPYATPIILQKQTAFLWWKAKGSVCVRIQFLTSVGVDVLDDPPNFAQPHGICLCLHRLLFSQFHTFLRSFFQKATASPGGTQTIPNS